MSESIDRRVVEMRFDNKEFEKNATDTMTVLEKLKEKLSFKGAGKNFEAASGLSDAIDGVRSRFSALEIMGTTALVNLTNSAVNLGKQMAKSLTVDQVRAGFSEYELKMGSIQTIMASTGADIGTVNKKLNELNTYSDKTIYSFSDMTNSIGKFTNAGVDLDTAVAAIQGISNEAAVSGANAQEASRAMYNFAQALSAGYVKLIDWKSIENANMATKEFKQQLIDTAVAEGTLEKAADGTYKVLTTGAAGGYKESITATKNFNDSLSAAWMTTDVLTKTLGRYADETTDIGKKAFAAAQDVKTFSQLVDTVKESIGSGWAQTFELIFGNLEEAKSLWTGVNNVISDFVGRSADARNSLLQTWHDSERGRAALLGGFKNLFNAVVSVVTPIKEAFRNVFPPATAKSLINLSVGFNRLTHAMIISDETASKIKRVFTVLFSVLKVGVNIVKGVAKIFGSFVKLFIPLGGTTLTLMDNISQAMVKMSDGASKLTEKFGAIAKGTFTKAISGLGKLFALLGEGLSKLNLAKVGGLLAGGGILAVGMKLIKFIDQLSEKLDGLFGKKEGGGPMDSVKETLGALGDALNTFQASLKVGQLLTIAASIGILAASCAVLADIPAKKLAVSVGAVGGLFVELAAASHLMQGAKTKGIIAMSVAVVILARAVKQLSEIEDLGKGLLGIGAVLGELTAFCLIFDRLKIKPRAFKKTGEGLILMAVAINLLAKPIKELGALDTSQLIQGLLAMGAMLGGFTLTALAFSKIKTKGLFKAGAAMVVMAASMRMLVAPLSQLGAMDLTSLAKGLGAMGIALIELAGFTAIMGTIASSTGNILKVSAALLVMSIGIKIMATAITQMGADSAAGQGLSAMFGALVILAGAMTLMQNSLAGAAAMVVVAGALMLMAPAIALLSSLNLMGVIVGLGALAGTLLLFAGLSALLGPLIPVMLGLAAAMALLGVGVLSLGAGMTMLVAAFSMATGPIVEGAKAISQAFPIIAKGIGEGIVTIIKTIGDTAEAIKEAFVKIIESIIEVIYEAGPRVIECGMQLIMMLLSGINDHIGEITTVAISIIVNFISAISDGTPALIDAGFNLIISFMDSLATAIVENGDNLANAFMNVILAALEAIVKLVPGFGKPAADAIEKYRKGFADGGKGVTTEARTISSNASTGLKIPSQYSNGTNAVQGLINGLGAMEHSAYLAGVRVGKAGDKGIKDGSGVASPSWKAFETGVYIIQGLVNGMDSYSVKAEESASNIATRVIGSYNSHLGQLDVFNGTFTPRLDMSRINQQVTAIDASFSRSDDRIADSITKLTRKLDTMTETMNSRQMNNYIQIDGAEDPTAFADALTDRFKIKVRTM